MNSFDVLSHLRRTGDEFCVTTFCVVCATFGCSGLSNGAKVVDKKFETQKCFSSTDKAFGGMNLFVLESFNLAELVLAGQHSTSPAPSLHFFHFGFAAARYLFAPTHEKLMHITLTRLGAVQ